jgi:hypothetical protein
MTDSWRKPSAMAGKRVTRSMRMATVNATIQQPKARRGQAVPAAAYFFALASGR